MKSRPLTISDTSFNLMFGIKKAFDHNLILSSGKEVQLPIEKLDFLSLE